MAGPAFAFQKKSARVLATERYHVGMGCVRCAFGCCALLSLLISQGCNGTDPRVAMIRSQVAARKELNVILAGVKDTVSMHEARKKLQARSACFQQLADEASRLDRSVSP